MGNPDIGVKQATALQRRNRAKHGHVTLRGKSHPIGLATNRLEMGVNVAGILGAYSNLVSFVKGRELKEIVMWNSRKNCESTLSNEKRI